MDHLKRSEPIAIPRPERDDYYVPWRLHGKLANEEDACRAFPIVQPCSSRDVRRFEYSIYRPTGYVRTPRDVSPWDELWVGLPEGRCCECAEQPWPSEAAAELRFTTDLETLKEDDEEEEEEGAAGEGQSLQDAAAPTSGLPGPGGDAEFTDEDEDPDELAPGNSFLLCILRCFCVPLPKRRTGN